MKTFRNSVLMQFIVMLFTVAIINVSCSKEALDAQCSTIAGPLINLENVPDSFEDMLELAWAVGDTNQFESLDDYVFEVFEDTPQNHAFVQKMEEEFQSYDENGFVNYITLQTNKGILSGEVKNRMINFSVELEIFMESEPTLVEFINYLNTKRINVKNSELCNNDKRFLTSYYNLAQGYAQFMWPDEAALANGEEIDIRGCNWYQAIICGIFVLAATVVAITIAAIVGLLIDITINGQKVASGDVDDLAILVGIALAIKFGENLFNWCCDILDGPEQDCQAPTGHFVKTLDCNVFKQTIFGPSTYGDTEWTNDNASPSSIITPTPVLEFQVPNYGEETTLEAVVTCMSGTNLNLYDYDTEGIYTTEEPLDLYWTSYPPSTIQLQNGSASYTVMVNTPSGLPYEYDWSINSPHTIAAYGNNATIYVYATGLVQINLTVTNTCTGEVDNLSASTFAWD